MNKENVPLNYRSQKKDGRCENDFHRTVISFMIHLRHEDKNIMILLLCQNKIFL